MKKLEDLFAQYFLYIRFERGFTESTCVTFITWARHFVRWMKKVGYENPMLDDFNPTVGLLQKTMVTQLIGRDLEKV